MKRGMREFEGGKGSVLNLDYDGGFKTVDVPKTH